MKHMISMHHRLITIITLGIILIATAHGSMRAYAENTPTASSTPSVHCGESEHTFLCMRNHFKVLTEYLSPEQAMQDMKELYKYDSLVISQCHQLSHTVGNTAVDLYHNDIQEAFTHGDSFCWSGYYHGVVERAITRIGKDAFIAGANTLCEKIPGKERYSFDYYNCVHGLGHGLMAIVDNELFTALPLCDNLTGGWEKSSCYGGVFMENVMVDNRTHNSKYLKPDDLMYPCNAVDSTYKGQCYLMQTSYALSQNGYDFAATFKLCAHVDEGYRDICVQSLGRDASGNSVSNVEITQQRCMLGLDDNQKRNCLVGAVKDFISYFHGGEQAHALCMAVPQRLQQDCLQTAASYMTTL